MQVYMCCKSEILLFLTFFFFFFFWIPLHIHSKAPTGRSSERSAAGEFFCLSRNARQSLSFEISVYLSNKTKTHAEFVNHTSNLWSWEQRIYYQDMYKSTPWICQPNREKVQQICWFYIQHICVATSQNAIWVLTWGWINSLLFITQMSRALVLEKNQETVFWKIVSGKFQCLETMTSFILMDGLHCIRNTC